MTNREWLQSLSNKDFAKVVLFNDCFYTTGNIVYHCPFWKSECPPDCNTALELWLDEEHKEQKVGDTVE